MPRYKLTIEYDGTGFQGWQRQASKQTVQDALETAVYHFCGSKQIVLGSGRTDAGVHARGQVAHLDLPNPYLPYTIQQALNYHLRPHLITVLKVEEVDETFHARYSATERCYEYHIINRSAALTLDLHRAWLVYKPLQLDQMRQGASYLVGKHDFSAFRAQECQASSPVKTLDELSIDQDGSRFIFFARARSFLHHQVRNMIGTLKMVGEGKLMPVDMERILQSKDRTLAGPTAPACGLYLMRVSYHQRSK
jgi:tRNA pseudouridine38-40 synthase